MCVWLLLSAFGDLKFTPSVNDRTVGMQVVTHHLHFL